MQRNGRFLAQNSAIPAIKSSLMYLHIAASIWKDLTDRFSQGNIARIFELQQKLMSLKQRSSDVTTYYTNLRIVWDEFIDTQPKDWCRCNFCRCDSQPWRDFQQQNFVVQFLMGLNDSYAQLRTQFLSLDPFPRISKIFALVIQEERQRNIGHIVDSSTPIFPVSEPPSMSVNAAGNFSNKSRDKLLCTHCNHTNHTVDKCYQLHGYPPGFCRGRGRGFVSDSVFQKSVHNVNHGNGNAAYPQSPSIPNQLPTSQASTPVNNLPSLSPDQCHQLISFLQGQIQGQTITGDIAQSASSSTSSNDYGPPFSGSFKANVD